MVAPRERGRLLLRIADAVEAEVEAIARTVALETGNAIRTQARPEIKSTADVIRYFGGVASEVKRVPPRSCVGSVGAVMTAMIVPFVNVVDEATSSGPNRQQC